MEVDEFEDVVEQEEIKESYGSARKSLQGKLKQTKNIFQPTPSDNFCPERLDAASTWNHFLSANNLERTVPLINVDILW